MAFAPASVTVKAFTMTAVTNAVRPRSPYASNTVAYDFMGGYWKAQIDLPPLTDAAGAAVEAWLLGLNGPKGTFQMYDFNPAGPFGTAINDATLKLDAPERSTAIRIQQVHTAASPSLVLNFAGNGRLGYLFGELAPGDTITLAGFLHRVVSAAPVGGLGAQDITVWPRLRVNMVAGDPVVIAMPYGTWALAMPENGWSRSDRATRAQSIEIVEAF